MPADSGIRPLPPVTSGPGAAALTTTRGGDSRLVLGAGLSIAQPVHEFREYVANGVGGSGYLLWRLDQEGVLGLRADVGGVIYGRETQRVPIVSGRITGRLTTTNNIIWAGLGPQLMVPRGPVRPYVNAAAGFSVFSTQSTLRRRDTDEELASDNNKTDGTWAWSGGGGVLLRVAPGFALDVGARYHANGSVEYLRRGGIVERPDGSVQLNPIRSRTDLWTWHVGLALGIGARPGGR